MLLDAPAGVFGPLDLGPQLAIGGIAHDVHHQPHPRAHRQRRPRALTQQLQALALILEQRLAQLRHVLLARGRHLRLDFHARGLARGKRFQPHPQRLGSQLGGAVDGALQARVLGIALDRARDQAGALELVEHPVEALGVDRPRGAEAGAETGAEVVAMAGTLQHETEDRALQRRRTPHPGSVAGSARTVGGLVINSCRALCGHLCLPVVPPTHSVCLRNVTPNRSQVQRT